MTGVDNFYIRRVLPKMGAVFNHDKISLQHIANVGMQPWLCAGSTYLSGAAAYKKVNKLIGKHRSGMHVYVHADLIAVLGNQTKYLYRPRVIVRLGHGVFVRVKQPQIALVHK